MEKLRTGDVVQIRTFGPNYILLGRGIDAQTGRPKVIMTKNGNVMSNGKARSMPFRRTARTRCEARIFQANPTEIKRIHGHRTVDINDIKENLAPSSGLSQYLVTMDGRNGLLTTAPNIHTVGGDLAQLKNH